MELDDAYTSHKPNGLISSQIAERNPRTEEITAKNANSDLLCLPQEIKQLIYESILEGQFIHIRRVLKKVGYQLTHYLCGARYSEKEAERIFAASTEPWFSTHIESRHKACCTPYARDTCFQCRKQSDIAIESYTQLSLAFFRCCRQLYKEACSTTFSKSTFSFTDSVDFLLFFLRPRSHIVFAIRSLHLDLIISNDADEQKWNMAFATISKDFKSLQHIYINIDQRPKEVEYLMQWSFEQPAECSFLRRLRTLRHLKLKTVTIIISDRHILHRDRMSSAAGSSYRWTMLQKQVWAEYIERVLIHQEEEEQLIMGEVV